MSRHERNKSKSSYPSLTSEQTIEQLDTSPTLIHHQFNPSNFDSTLNKNGLKNNQTVIMTMAGNGGSESNYYS